MDTFFTGFGTMFPYIYKNNLLDRIADLDSWTSKGAPRSWLCLMNTIMAFATTDATSTQGWQDRGQADKFIQRALKLLPDVSLQRPNLETGKTFEI